MAQDPGYPQGSPDGDLRPPPYGAPGYPPVGSPAPVPVKKKGGAGKVLLIIAAVLVVLCGGAILVVALALGGAKSGTTTSPAHASLNQAARDGKFEFVVTKVSCGKATEGTDPLIKTAQGQYCEVTVTVKNISDKPQTFAGLNQHANGAN